MPAIARRALQRACGLGIIHRDVKPGNVFLGRDPDKEAAGDPFPFTVKVGDLGLARPSGGEVEADMDLLRAFYADKVGKYPERFGEVRLREEDE